MASTFTPPGPLLLRRLDKKPTPFPPCFPSSSRRRPAVYPSHKRLPSIWSSMAAASTPQNPAPAIILTDKALRHLKKMRADRNEDLCLRVGVKQGGCSGMSYNMEFENSSNTRPHDSIIDYDGFTIVCDPRSLLFLYGMQLDFSEALIGGGFLFKNPNAAQTCGCGKSFAA